MFKLIIDVAVGSLALLVLIAVAVCVFSDD